MQISPEDRNSSDTTKNKSTVSKSIALIIAVCILGGLGYYLLEQPKPKAPKTTSIPIEETTTVEVPPPPPKEQEEKPKIEIPEKTTAKPASNFTLPTLDNSDPEAKKHLDNISTEKNFSYWFHPDHIIRRGITFIDGLSRGLQLKKMLKAPMPQGQFLAVKEGNKLWLNPENYQRYDYFIKVIEAIDNDTLVKSFHLFRPLLEEAYGELGYPPKDLGKAVIAALDQILAAPIQHEPIALTRESVQYKYADLELEALPPIQKQLLRMGPDNTQIIQEKAQLLRGILLQ